MAKKPPPFTRKEDAKQDKAMMAKAMKSEDKKLAKATKKK
jgi:hypothetical protein